MRGGAGGAGVKSNRSEGLITWGPLPDPREAVRARCKRLARLGVLLMVGGVAVGVGLLVYGHPSAAGVAFLVAVAGAFVFEANKGV